MKKENPDYKAFYMDLPQAEYLEDIEIQDEYGDTDENKARGLSEQQVVELAQDSLQAAIRQPAPHHQSPSVQRAPSEATRS